MRHYRRMILQIAACLSLFAFLLTGCGEQQEVYVPVTSNTVEVTEEGRLIAYIVEDFEKDYYDISELDTMVRSEIDVYNENNAALSAEAGQVPVLVEKVIMAEDGSAKAVVALNFQNAAVYEDYMGKELFYGTVSEAVEAGYELEENLFNVKNGEALNADKNAKKHVLIVEDAVLVRTPDKVQYLSANASLTAEGFVDAGAEEEYKYIITK